MGINLKSGFEVENYRKSEHLDIRTMEIGSGVKCGQGSKLMGCF